MNIENWKEIPCFEGLYEISDRGRVKSLGRTIRLVVKGQQRNRVLKEKIMLLSSNIHGYPFVILQRDGVAKTFGVHRIVMEVFMGPDNGNQVDHINGDKQDNRLENLRYVTKAENLMGFMKPRKNCSSKYRGVSWIKNFKKWRAKVTTGKKTITVGHYATEMEAVEARDEAARQLGFHPSGMNLKMDVSTPAKN